jgi:hypothetical protein
VSEAKQIEEMAETLDKMCDLDLLADCGEKDCSKCMATALYNAGYRKQIEGEWISVEEKNPEDVYGKDREKITVLVCTKSGKVSASTRCARYSYDHKQNTWVRTGEFEWSGSKKVTHWMPMPNPYRGRDDQQEGMYI